MNIGIAILAGGCFWGMEDLFSKLEGVTETRVGYAGGEFKNPTYNDVKKGKTGHAEALEVKFDESKTNYEKILKFFFKIHDPTTLNQQGNDLGTQYRSAIFYTSEAQKKTAERVLLEIQKSGVWKKPIVTEIKPSTEFYLAEDYHQDYLKKNPGGYTCHYIRDYKI
jgi:methionine-S-sulfoxide reductase